MPVYTIARTEYFSEYCCDKCGLDFPGFTCYEEGKSKYEAQQRAIRYGAKQKDGKIYCDNCYSKLESDNA